MVGIIVKDKKYHRDAWIPKSKEERKKMEREGHVFGTPEELRRIAKQNRKYNIEKEEKKRLNFLKESFYNINNGKSYIKQFEREARHAKLVQEREFEQFERERREIMGKSQ